MEVNPEAAGMSAERLARIDEHLLERYITDDKIHGAIVD